MGTLEVNGPGITGSVPVGTTRLYTLANIEVGRNYTVRTEIATRGDGTTPDGTLNVSIYKSEDAFKSDPTNSVAILAPNANFPYVYEVNFTAQSSGNYVAAISGASQTIIDTQFFYDLRVMSADPDYRISFPPNSSVTTTLQASSPTVATNLDYMHVYSGGTITSSGGLYPVNLRVVSAITVTSAYPQLFVYGDPSLSIGSLLYSSVTDSMNFNITTFNPGTAPTTTFYPTNTLASGVTISSVPFTSPTPSSSGSPFIVVRGTSAVSYVLTVGPAP